MIGVGILANSMDKRLLMVINPVSGKMRIREELLDIIEVFCKNGYDVSVKTTAYKGHATEIVADMGGGFDLVVMCGGDGTLNEGISGMLNGGHNVPVGYIPSGTTNDFATSVDIEQEDLRLTAENIARGSRYGFDVGRFDGRHFCYIACFGAFADTAFTAPQTYKNAFGHAAYILEGLRDLPYIKPCHVKVTLEGQVLEDDYIFGAVSNSTSIGKIVKLDSELVNFSDGKFELMLIKNPKNAIELSKILLAIQMQRYDDDCVTFYQTKKAVFEMEPVSWSLDGEYAEGREKVVIEILPRAVTLQI